MPDPSTPPDHSAGVRPLGRSPHRRKAGPLPKIGMAVFTIGLIAIVADIALFASGSRSLPLWIGLIALLAPIGLFIGFLGTRAEGRQWAAEGSPPRP